METPIQPILLLADSQLLFWRTEEGLFLERIRQLLPAKRPRAAYLGASNGDLPEFFGLFQGAMGGVGIFDCHHVPAEPSPADLTHLGEADLILLAGGDPALGWRSFKKHGLDHQIVERYYHGALLVGVSAGAVQLGLFGAEETREGLELFEAVKLVPYLVDAHDEPDWPRLGRALREAGEHVRGLGIPAGGGALVHPDLAIEPIRNPATEMSLAGGGTRRALIFPPGPEDSPPGTRPGAVTREVVN